MLVGQTKIAQRFFPNIKNLSYFLSPEKYLVWQSWPGFTEDQNQSGKLANFSAQTTVKEQALTWTFRDDTENTPLSKAWYVANTMKWLLF